MATAVVGRSGTELLTTTEDTQAVGITSDFGKMALERQAASNPDISVGDVFLKGVQDGAGLRDLNYDRTAQEQAAAEADAANKSNWQNIAIWVGGGLVIAALLSSGGE